jgi:hypothetical protein
VGCSLTSWYAAASVTLGALGKPDIDNGGSTRWAVRSLPGTLPPLSPEESRPKAAARLDFEVSAGWLRPSSRGLWGGDALLLSTGAAGTLQR